MRHLVELHGGTVCVESEGVGRGALFTVRLPLRAIASEEIADTGSGAAGRVRGGRPLGDSAQLDGKRVLVVDDEADARELLTAVLEHHGAEVVSAGGVDEALPLLQRLRPHALVSDIGMPGADGYELIRRVRALPPDQGGSTPATALTGFARPEDGQRALSAGFTAHMAKPVDPVVLVETVHRLIHNADAPALSAVR